MGIRPRGANRASTSSTRAEVGERGVIAFVYLAGVSAAVALGRFIPLEAGVRNTFDLSLTAFGWLVSSVTVVAACLALPAGSWAARRNQARVLSAGLGVMLLGGLAEVTAPTAFILYGARVLEGAGYLAVVVTGPLVLSARCGAETQRGALALWSTFIPVGIAVSSAIGTVDDITGWRVAGGLTLAPAALALGATLRWLPDAPSPAGQHRRPHIRGIGPVLLLSLSFALLALLGVTAVALLPNLAADRGVSSAVGSGTAALVSLASVPGGLLAGRLLGRVAGARALGVVVLVMPCAGALMYQARSWGVVVAGATTLQFAGGMVLAVLYASVPLVARSSHELGRGYGLLNQAGSVGTLVGPPAFGLSVTRAGWTSATALVTVVSLVGLLLFLAATRRPEPSAQ